MSDLVHRLEAASTLCVTIDSKDVITQILCHARRQSGQHPVGFSEGYASVRRSLCSRGAQRLAYRIGTPSSLALISSGFCCDCLLQSLRLLGLHQEEEVV